MPEEKSITNLYLWLVSKEDMTIKIIVVLSLLITWVNTKSRQNKIKKDQDISTVLVLSHRVIMDELLSDLCRQLNIRNTGRISVYGETKKCFVILGRYSDNQSYRQTGERGGIYAKGADCISIAWEKGEASDRNMPRNKAAWVVHQVNKWKMTKHEAEGVNFRCRSIVAIRLHDPQRNNLPTGVVVFESEQPTGVELQSIQVLIHGEKVNTLTKLLCLLNDVGIEEYIIANARKGL